ERHRRVQQHFLEELEPSHQDLLSWGSALGTRFLRQAVLDLARSRQQPVSDVDPEQTINECVDPLAVLHTPAPELAEFRDRAWYAAARQHFDECHGELSAE